MADGRSPASTRPAGVPRELEAAVARIRSGNGVVVGSGFLVGPRHVLTCAHVVTQALGGGTGDVLGSTVRVEFPLLGTPTAADATVELWRPPLEDDRGDVAVLSLVGSAPAGLLPARPLITDDLWGHGFRAFGFPYRHDHGVWASGVLRARQGAGWVQMEGTGTGHAVEPGFSGSAVWDDELAGIVGMTVAAEAGSDVRASYLIPTEVLLREWPPLGERSLSPCPYRGLYAFTEQDAHLLKGRDDLAERLAEEVDRKPLVAVVGPSGSGKSSVVFAGLIPRLLQSPRWSKVSLRPSQSTSPLLALAAALLPVLEPERSEVERFTQIGPLADALRQGRLPDVVQRILERSGTTRLLLVVDQFEEVFAGDPKKTEEMVDVLLDATSRRTDSTDRSLTVLLTLRADFLTVALQAPDVASALGPSITAIGQMTRDQLRDVIVAPLPPGVRYEESLVDLILDDIGDEPGSLPLLEFALTLLWERQEHGVLTHAAYRDLGRVKGALAAYAERIYEQRVAAGNEDQARRLFTQLVRPSDVGPVRRVARRSDLGPQQWQLAQDLAGTRLLVTDRDAGGDETVELVHEALIHGWSRLRTWVEADRGFRHWQEQLRDSHERWLEHDRDSGALLRGGQLEEAATWLSLRRDEISGPERDYIQTSRSASRWSRGVVAGLACLLVVALGVSGVAYWAFDRESDRARARALLDEAAALADQRPDVALQMTAAAYRAAATADAARSLTRLVTAHRDVGRFLVTDVDVVQGIAVRPGKASEVVLTSTDEVVLWDPARGRVAEKDFRNVYDTAVSPQGDTVAVLEDLDESPRLSVWRLGAEPAVSSVDLPDMDAVSSSGLAISPDGDLVGVCAGNQVLVFSTAAPPVARGAVTLSPDSAGEACDSPFGFTADGRVVHVQAGEVRTFSVTGGSATTRDVLPDVVPEMGRYDDGERPSLVGISPDGRRLAYRDPDAGLQWWDLRQRRPIDARERTGVNSLRFSPDSRWAITETHFGTVEVIDVADLSTRAVYGLQASTTDASQLLAVGDDGVPHVATNAYFAPGTDGSVVAVWRGPARGDLMVDASTSAVRVGRDGRLVTVSGSGQVVVRPNLTGTATTVAQGHERAEEDPFIGYAAPVISADGLHVASPGRTPRELDIIDVDTGRTTTETDHQGALAAVAFDARGRFLVSSDGRTAVVRNARSREVVGRIRLGEASSSIAVAVHPDGELVAASTGTGLLLLQTGEPDAARRIPVEEAGAVQFSPDGRWLAVATPKGLRLWDVDRQALRPESLTDSSDSFAFSQDGTQLAVASQDAIDSAGHVLVVSVPALDVRSAVAAPNNNTDVSFTTAGRLALAYSGGLQQIDPPTPTEAIARVCSLTRSLSSAEWRRFAEDLEPERPCE